MAVAIAVASCSCSGGKSGGTQTTIPKKNITPDQRVEI
jgi:hypothetical protein